MTKDKPRSPEELFKEAEERKRKKESLDNATCTDFPADTFIRENLR